MPGAVSNLDFNQFSTTDLSLTREFIDECKDSSIPIAIVGNGGSTEELTDDQIKELNSYRLFRCNWAFKDPSAIKKSYAFYISQAYGSGPDHEIVPELDSSLEQGVTKIYRFSTQILYSWNKIISFSSPTGHPVWPTSGVQLLWHAAFHIPTPSIHIAGMDMYTYKRPARYMNPEELKKWMQDHGKKYSSLEDKSVGTSFMKPNLRMVDTTEWVNRIKEFKSTQHYLEIDVLAAMIAIAHCTLRDVQIYIYNCPNLDIIRNITVHNLDIIKDYYAARRMELNDPRMKPVCYNMWRLLNSTVDKVIDD